MFIFLTVFCVFLLCFYFYGTRNYAYWKSKGIKCNKTIPFLGTDAKLILHQTSTALHYASMYSQYPAEKVVGFYRAMEPCILIRDPEMIKKVLTTDFHSFYPRGLVPCKDDPEPMFKNLFTADGDSWKLLRQRLTPMFSAARLKAMFPLIVERAAKLQDLSANIAQSGETFNLQDLMGRYTTDFIGACAFGIDMDTLNDENSQFRKLGKRIFKLTARDIIIGAIKVTFPVIGSNLKFFASEVEEGIVYLLKSVMEQRNYKPSKRNDFIDILIEMSEKGTIVGESIEHKNEDGTPKIVSMQINEELLAAQVFVFFAAGFETSSSTSSFALHLLAFHPEKQQKVYEEVVRVLTKHDNVISYESIQEMEYLEMVINESLRILPPVGTLMRKSATKYTFPEVGVSIDPGVGVYISSYALHHDSKYFEDPEEFIPERFDIRNGKSIDKYTFLPFGEGYRGCIGARLGIMQTMAGMAALLHKFEVVPAPSSLRNPVLANGINITQAIVGGLPAILKERK